MDFLPITKDGHKVYAGFWKRFGAATVDLLVFIPFIFIVHYLKGISIGIAMITVIIYSTLSSMYTIYFHYRFGATLGKMAVGIKVALPNGSAIGLKQAILRSSVDLGFALFIIIAQIIALSNVDPEQYLSAGWIERSRYIVPLFPAWYGVVAVGFRVWYWSELLVLLFNKRKRAIHDFIAGTVVIQQQYAEQGIQLNAAKREIGVRP